MKKIIFSNTELNQIDSIKYHIITDAEKNGVVLPAGEITDKVALQFALALAEKYIKDLYQMPKKKKGFFS